MLFAFEKSGSEFCSSNSLASRARNHKLILLWSVVATLVIFGSPAGSIAASSNGSGILDGFVEWFSNDVISGKGTSVSTDGFGRTTATWSDGHNKLKVKIDGEVEFGDDDRTISHLSRSGSLTIWEIRGSRKTRLEVNADRNGDLTYEFEVDGKVAPFDDNAKAWLGETIVEIIRKTGIGAEERANRILDDEGVNGLLDEVQYVESDYVMRKFIGAALARPSLTSEDCSAIVSEAALSMESDYEKAELLLTIAEHRSWTSALASDYVEVVATMESDYEIRRALSAIKLDDQTDPAALDAILRIAARMESDYETAELLKTYAPSCHGSDRLSDMYVRAVQGIESDYEARRALMELDWREGMPMTAIVGALNVAGRLESDYEAAELLTELAPYSCDDQQAIDAFMTAVSQVDSDYESGRSLQSFGSNDRLSEQAVLAALRAAGTISSSYEQCGVLKKLVRHCHGSQKLEDAFLETVELVGSDYERDQLYSDFYRGDREARRARRGE
jgi:hypothetical protein